MCDNPQEDLRELFVANAYWFRKYLSNPGAFALVSWILAQLDTQEEKLRQKLVSMFRMSKPIQEEAEKALCDFLSDDDQHVWAERRRTRRTPKLSRNVDWPLTYERNLIQPPLEYWERSPARFPDEELMSALLGLAESWGVMCDVANCTNRRDRLRDAIERHRNVRRRSVSYDSRMSRRLWNVEPEVAEKIDKALELSRSLTDESDKKDALKQVAEVIQDYADRPVLLERVALLSIARAAEECGWKVSQGQVRAPTDGGMPKIELKSGDGLRCMLGKMKPEDGGEGYSDRLSFLREQLDFKAGTGHEPDITLEFTPIDAGNKIYVLADAKKYGSGSNMEACVSDASKYLVAYGHLMGVSMKEGGNGNQDPFVCKVKPALTLFFLKGVQQVGGVSIPGPGHNRQAQMEQTKRNIEDGKLTSIMALDCSHISMESGEPSNLLQSWFKRVADQADEYLRS